MKNNLRSFSVEIPIGNEQAMQEFQNTMDEIQESINKYIVSLMQELDITHECALDVYYLRTRSRWNEALEQDLIRLHKEGNPPNICEFG